MPIKKERVVAFLLLTLIVVAIIFVCVRIVYRSLATATGTASPAVSFVGDSFGLGVAQESASGGMGMMQAKRFATNIAIPEPPGYGSVAADVPVENRLIIKSGTVSLVVDNVPNAIEDIRRYAIEKSGFVVSSNIEKSVTFQNKSAFYGSVTIRVPAHVFEESMTVLGSFGEVQSQQVNGQDITEEFVDVQAQLRNLKATEDQFLVILRQAVRIEDILAVQRELSNVRSQIELFEGRKKYLAESAAMSTITVQLATDPEELPVLDESEQWKPLAVVKDAARDLVLIARGAANALIRFVVYLPIWVVGGVILWAAVRFGRRWWNRFFP